MMTQKIDALRYTLARIEAYLEEIDLWLDRATSQLSLLEGRQDGQETAEGVRQGGEDAA